MEPLVTNITGYHIYRFWLVANTVQLVWITLNY